MQKKKKNFFRIYFISKNLSKIISLQGVKQASDLPRNPWIHAETTYNNKFVSELTVKSPT